MEEQKKTQGEAGGDSLFDGGFDTAVPERPWATLKRLWPTAQDQHLRLLVVVLTPANFLFSQWRCGSDRSHAGPGRPHSPPDLPCPPAPPP